MHWRNDGGRALPHASSRLTKAIARDGLLVTLSSKLCASDCPASSCSSLRVDASITYVCTSCMVGPRTRLEQRAISDEPQYSQLIVAAALLKLLLLPLDPAAAASQSNYTNTNKCKIYTGCTRHERLELLANLCGMLDQKMPDVHNSAAEQ